MIRVLPLADHSAAVPVLAAGFQAEWPDWYGPAGPGDALADLRARATDEGLPLGLVALDGDTAVGAVALAEQSIATHAHLSPWIIGLWVAPGDRRRGIGGRLVGAALDLAAARAMPRLYAATGTAASLFRRPDWRLYEAVETDGERLMVFEAEPLA